MKNSLLVTRFCLVVNETTACEMSFVIIIIFYKEFEFRLARIASQKLLDAHASSTINSPEINCTSELFITFMIYPHFLTLSPILLL